MDSKYTMAKLNADNYFNWKFKMEMFLRREKAWKAITEDAPSPDTTEWTEANEKALTAIALCVDDSQIQHIRDCKTAKESWIALREIHEKDNTGNRVHLLQMIMRERLEIGGDAEAHVNRIHELFQKLMSLGAELKPEFIMCGTMLASLDSSYDALVTALETKEEKDLTSSFVRSKIIAEYRRRKDRDIGANESTALKIGQAKNSNTFVCYHCNETGHIKRNCLKFKKQKQDGQHKANVVANDTNSDDGESLFAIGNIQGCIVDSGATCHIFSERDAFIEFNADHREKVFVATKQEVMAQGRGTVLLNILNDRNELKKIRMNDVLFVPEIDGNIISVKRLAQRGLRVEFFDEKCEIKSGDRSQQYGVADLVDNLYNLRLKCEQSVNMVSEERKMCIHRWHEGLGHRDINVVKGIPKADLVHGMRIVDCDCQKDVKCSICLKGKMSRPKFPKQSENRAKAVLDLIHSDVCGPMSTATPSGKRYILTFIDDFSRFSTTYLLKEKSEVFGKFKEFFEWTKNQFGKQIKAMRHDNGGEYIGNEFEIFVKQHGIVSQRTAPYTPQQNGVAERKNRTLIEMGKCMLFDANLERRFWGEATMTANFIQNLLPWKSVPKTPYELWFGKQPNYADLHRFGDECFVFVPKEKRKKLDEKAIAAIFVGYDQASKAARCYVPEKDRVVVSRDVTFTVNNMKKAVNVNNNNKKQSPKTMEDSTIEFCFSNHEQVNLEEENSYDQNITIFTDAQDLTATNDSESDEYDENGRIEEEQAQDNDTPLGRRTSSRSTKGIPPRRLINEINLIENEDEPQSYREAVTCKQKSFWIDAMKEELRSLQENETWNLVEAPKDRKPIGCKWVFKLKRNSVGKPLKYKARLVAQGFNQKYGIDYDQVFAPVAKQTTLRILLSVAAKKDMKVIHLDAKTAFLNGTLDETIYMKQPPGFLVEDQETQVCLLQKSIYGLKQSARVWNQTVHETLVNAGLTRSANDGCLYTKTDERGTIYMILYVDDVLMASNSDEMLQFYEDKLREQYKIENLGEVRNYLGIRIEKHADGYYTLNQSQYIAQIIKELGLATAKISDIPLSVGYGKSESNILPHNEKYRRIIGCLLYISINTRPDISAAVSILARKVATPTEEDWNEVKRVVKYLKGTINHQLKLGCDMDEKQFFGYADADWANDKSTRKSNSGYVIMLGTGTVSWSCKKQSCVADSTAVAEFISLSEACKEILWLRRLLADFGFNITEPTVIHEDNQSCLMMVENEEQLSSRTKHIETKIYFVKDYVEKNEVRCIYCPTEEMLADMLTKPLARERLQRLREDVGIHLFK